HHHPEGPRLGPVAPGDHLPGAVDATVGQGADLRDHPRAPRRGAGGPERPHHRRAGHALGRTWQRPAIRRRRQDPSEGADPMKIGMIGCGVISRQYLESFDRLPDVQLVAVADLDRVRAEAAAEGREGVRVLSVDELIADAEVDTVLNLTIPAAHAEVDLRAI